MAKKLDLTSLIQKYDTTCEKESFDSGIEVFNELWGGGLVKGYMYGFYATPGTGKTSLCLQMIRKQLKDGKKCCIVDIEKSINQFQIETFGLSDYLINGQLVIVTMTDFSEYEEFMLALAEDGSYEIVFVDSVTAIQPFVKAGLTVEDIRPGLRALQASQVQARIKSAFYYKGITSLMVFQARANLDMTGNMYAPKEKTAAGFTERHLLDIETKLTTSSQIKEDDKVIGNKVWIECTKNKFRSPFEKRQASLIFGKGISKRIELVDRAIELGIIQQRGSSFIVPGEGGNIKGRKALYDMPAERLKEVQKMIKTYLDKD